LGQLETRCGLLQVTAPVTGSKTNQIMYTNKDQIELACLEEAHHQFTQAADTPMLQQPRISCFGLANIDSVAFQKILDGTFQCLSTCDLITKHLLQQLARPDRVVDHHLRMYKEFYKGWSQAWETTALSPSGIHFGHYMVVMMNMMVAKLNAILANLALLSRSAPECWKKH